MSDRLTNDWTIKQLEMAIPIDEGCANQLAKQLLATMQREKKNDEALLLAARWFKINYDCHDDVPPSKSDLAGMFDAMQAARSEGSVAEVNKD